MKKPVPRNYNEIRVPVEVLADAQINGMDKIVTVLSCKSCGALVLMPLTHNAWHKQQGQYGSVTFRNRGG